MPWHRHGITKYQMYIHLPSKPALLHAQMHLLDSSSQPSQCTDPVCAPLHLFAGSFGSMHPNFAVVAFRGRYHVLLLWKSNKQDYY